MTISFRDGAQSAEVQVVRKIFPGRWDFIFSTLNVNSIFAYRCCCSRTGEVYFESPLQSSHHGNHSKYTYTYFQCFNLKVKSWSNLQKRTEILLKDLAKENCDGGKKLKEIWSTNSKYLLSSYLAWMPEVLHDDITKLWPPSIP